MRNFKKFRCGQFIRVQLIDGMVYEGVIIRMGTDHVVIGDVSGSGNWILIYNVDIMCVLYQGDYMQNFHIFTFLLHGFVIELAEVATNLAETA